MRRKISTTERFMLFFGRQYPLNFGFKVKLNQPFDAARGRDSLRGLARRHTLLFSHHEYTSGKKMDMVFPDEVPLLVKEAPSQDAWESILLSRMNFEFDPFTGPLFTLDWRNCGNESELFFVFHHGAADGIAAVYFIHDFVSHYAGLGVEIPPQPFLPTLYDALNGEIVDELLKRPEPEWKKQSPPPPKPFTVPPYKAPDYFLRFFEMSEPALRLLADEAKAADSTVNSYLGAMILQASAEIFGPESGSERTIQCPVDMRPYLMPEYRAVAGAYNGIVKVRTDCSQHLAAVAKDVKDGIIQKRSAYLDIEEYFHFRDSFDSVEDPESLMMSFPPDVIDYDFSFSNLGRTVIAPEYNSLIVSELYGPVFTAVFDETVIGLNTTGGVLRMSLIFSRSIAKAKEYERLGGKIAAIFKRYESAAGN